MSNRKKNRKKNKRKINSFSSWPISRINVKNATRFLLTNETFFSCNLLPLHFIPLVVLAKRGFKCNNKDCEPNEHNAIKRRFSTSPMELLGNEKTAVIDVIAITFLFLHHFSRSQTLSPVRNYNTLAAAKEPKFVTVKRTTEQVVSKPYKVNISQAYLFKRLEAFSV